MVTSPEHPRIETEGPWLFLAARFFSVCRLGGLIPVGVRWVYSF
jgi:hypothetical protein